jgi:DNA-binding SARP family transcriptional activator/streptogramin lyase
VATSTTQPSFRLLGHLRIDGAGEEIRGLKQRTLLAFLVLHAGEVVSTQRLVDAVWGERPPPTAAAIVHGYVRKLRAALAEAPAELLTRAPGYVLQLDDGELDVRVFERLADEGRDALRAGDAEAARATLVEALALWHGEPLGDLPEEGFVAEERRRLEQRRAEATADRIDADLAVGRSGELVAELETLVREQPFQEGPRRQLMLALYRSGRQADALELYRETRRIFVDELGIEPSRSLQELEQAMLRQDDSLEQAPAEFGTPANAALRSRRPLAIAASVLVVSAAIALSLALSGGSARSPVKPRPAKILASLDLPQPSCCGFGFDAAWGVGHHDDILRKIDARTGHVIAQWPVAGFQSGVPLAAAGSVWVPSATGQLVRFDPARHKVVKRIPIEGVKVAFGYLDIWETTLAHQLDRVDLHTNKVVHQLRLAPGANNWTDELAIGEGAVWVAVADNATLDRIDPVTNKIVGSITGFGNTDSGMPIAIDQNAVWVLRMVGGQETLFRVDPDTSTIVQRIPIGPPNGTSPTGTVTTGGGYVWTGDWNRTVSKVDPHTNRVVAVYTLPNNAQNVTFGDGSLWVDSYDASKVWRINPNG